MVVLRCLGWRENLENTELNLMDWILDKARNIHQISSVIMCMLNRD